MLINQRTLEIIATAFGNGKTHDFRLFKDNYAGMAANIHCLADTGYLGLTKLHSNSQIPAKKSKLHPLTAEQKVANRALARQRIFGEHVIGRLKVFASWVTAIVIAVNASVCVLTDRCHLQP